MKLYGIKACDTCRKALKAIENKGLSADFWDIRQTPLSPETLRCFLAEFGEDLLNRRSTTWRNLSETERARPADELLQDHPTLMKRPVIERDGVLTMGWSHDVQAIHLGE